MKKVLFLSNQTDRHWISSLRQATFKMGKLLLLADHSKLETELLLDCELVILDSGTIGDLPSVIRSIRSAKADTRVVVISSAPTWKQAREVLLAGATDYLRKADDENSILDIVQGKASTMG